MFCDWSDNQQYLFPGESSIKIHIFRVRREKISYAHTENNIIRTEISTRAKASQVKFLHSEILRKVKRQKVK